MALESILERAKIPVLGAIAVYSTYRLVREMFACTKKFITEYKGKDPITNTIIVERVEVVDKDCGQKTCPDSENYDPNALINRVPYQGRK
jgi:hypothetical protein